MLRMHILNSMLKRLSHKTSKKNTNTDKKRYVQFMRAIEWRYNHAYKIGKEIYEREE